jgi:hypothetical protein
LSAYPKLEAGSTDEDDDTTSLGTKIALLLHVGPAYSVRPSSGKYMQGDVPGFCQPIQFYTGVIHIISLLDDRIKPGTSPCMYFPLGGQLGRPPKLEAGSTDEDDDTTSLHFIIG